MMESWILMILVIVSGVQSGDWGVTFENQCALKGASVVIKCSYSYPFAHIVTSVSWGRILYVSGQRKLFLLSSLSSPQNHYKYVGNYYGNCDLQINNVQNNDEGEYYFRFVTTFNKWTSKTFVHLSVKELTAVVEPSTVTEGNYVNLTCLSACPTPTTIVWFRDGQLVQKPVFQAMREDAGRYYCAVPGQQTVRSAPVALNVLYAPKKVTLSVNQSGGVVRGSSVTFTCSSEANPPVRQSGYSLYKDGQFISSGQRHIISDIQSSHSGQYHCQAWNSISWRDVHLINSTEIHLDVWYPPMDISVSVDPAQVAEGSSVNLTCSSVANPAADSYTWYKRTTGSPSSSSLLQVGTGQVLSLSSVEASHAGLYLCRARNRLGEDNSTEVPLTIEGKGDGRHTLPVLAGVGVVLFVTLITALLLFWRKQRILREKKQQQQQTEFDSRFSGRGSSASANQVQLDPLYANIHTSQSSSPLDIAPQSQRNWQNEHDASTSFEDEVTYSVVTIKPRNHTLPHHINNSKAPRDSWSRAGESDSSVIYATVASSSKQLP
ncbi:B-cell receptor CD22-like isoform X2 [Toxotes jaculatrix]|uniref:B-cell receptor CD22-like isoform X2 n=1 Tax=Toxotes jaculatrix TaxID=941984 RepID=UPI001B3A801C|nr:B-cell receptor CD22-like isoform X2 [Toxotes jaculatrix]